MSAKTKTDCSHRLPFGLKWAGRDCKHATVKQMDGYSVWIDDQCLPVRCDDCHEGVGILCLDCGRVY